MGGDSPDEDVELLRQAQEWSQSVGGARFADQDGFARWLRTSPRHVEAYLRITMIETELDGANSEC
jgi:ferric-dicitrate binding protein FerR (iron transport regulator)